MAEKAQAYADSVTDWTLSSCGGHYTQVVWRESVALGCGWKAAVPFTVGGRTYRGLLTVCEYGPGGNINGRDPY